MKQTITRNITCTEVQYITVNEDYEVQKNRVFLTGKYIDNMLGKALKKQGIEDAIKAKVIGYTTFEYEMPLGEFMTRAEIKSSHDATTEELKQA